MPLHTGKGRTVARALGRITAYVENPEKTDGGELISAYACNADIADKEFLFAQRQYENITGRKQKRTTSSPIICGNPLSRARLQRSGPTKSAMS